MMRATHPEASRLWRAFPECRRSTPLLGSARLDLRLATVDCRRPHTRFFIVRFRERPKSSFGPIINQTHCAREHLAHRVGSLPATGHTLSQVGTFVIYGSRPPTRAQSGQQSLASCPLNGNQHH